MFPLNMDFKDEDSMERDGVEIEAAAEDEPDDIRPPAGPPLLNLAINGFRNGDLAGNFNSRPCISSFDKGMAM